MLPSLLLPAVVVENQRQQDGRLRMVAAAVGNTVRGRNQPVAVFLAAFCSSCKRGQYLYIMVRVGESRKDNASPIGLPITQHRSGSGRPPVGTRGFRQRLLDFRRKIYENSDSLDLWTSFARHARKGRGRQDEYVPKHVLSTRPGQGTKLYPVPNFSGRPGQDIKRLHPPLGQGAKNTVNRPPCLANRASLNPPFSLPA
jgi:hypothetical protein